MNGYLRFTFEEYRHFYELHRMIKTTISLASYRSEE